MRQRLPGPEATPAALRDRSWWQGPELHVLVDDYELVATTTNPLAPLLPYLAQARDVGLHLYVARRAGGASRALLDPVLGGMRELNFPAVLLSAPRDEIQLLGLRPGPAPARPGDTRPPAVGDGADPAGAGGQPRAGLTRPPPVAPIG